VTVLLSCHWRTAVFRNGVGFAVCCAEGPRSGTNRQDQTSSTENCAEAQYLVLPRRMGAGDGDSRRRCLERKRLMLI